MTNESIIYICTTVAGIVTILVKGHLDNQKFLAVREQDRLDRESDAKIRQADKKEIIDAGDERKKEIVKETRQTRTVALKAALKSEEAIVAANNLTSKSTAAVEIATKALEKVSGEPVQVEVVNDPSHPIPTERTNP